MPEAARLPRTGEVHPANTGAGTWRYKLPCGHRGGVRQPSFPDGHPKAYRCTTCYATHPKRTDLKTGMVVS